MKKNTRPGLYEPAPTGSVSATQVLTLEAIWRSIDTKGQGVKHTPKHTHHYHF